MTLRERPIKFGLHPEDVLVFLHIPKTAGLSLFEILKKHFPVDRICPVRGESDAFGRMDPDQVNQFRLIVTHGRLGPYSALARCVQVAPLFATMLREPVARTLSAYNHIRRYEQNPLHVLLNRERVSVNQFITDSRFTLNHYNPQTRRIAGSLEGNIEMSDRFTRYGEDVWLEIAKQRLQQFVFVGLVERFEESIGLLKHTFGWRDDDRLPAENVAPKPISRDDLPAEIVDRIVENSRLDMQLYDYACDLFRRRFERMLEESGE